MTHEVPTFAPEFEPQEAIVGLGGFIIKESEPTTTFIIYIEIVITITSRRPTAGLAPFLVLATINILQECNALYTMV